MCDTFGVSVMDNHLHLLLRLDQDVAKAWSDEEVVRRWGRLFPPRDKSRQPLPVAECWVQWRLKDAQWVATARERLQSISWFMKCLKEPLSRLANRQDSAESWRARLEKLRTGRLFGRFFAASRERLRQVARHLDVRRVANLAGCPAR